MIYATKIAEQDSADLNLALLRGWEPFGVSMVVLPGPAGLAGPRLVARGFVAVRKLYDPSKGVPDTTVANEKEIAALDKLKPTVVD